MSRIKPNDGTPRRSVTEVSHNMIRVQDLDTSTDTLAGGALIVVRGPLNTVTRSAYGDDIDEVRI